MSAEPTPVDRQRVRALLGREPQGHYTVAARSPNGDPSVIRNAPFLDDGTPMPTLYWLIDPDEVRAMGQLEADGGVDTAEAEVDADELAEAHARYAAERDAEIASEHEGPRPYGGVAGTRVGVKCLHAHRAWHLAGGDDPVGRWIEGRLSQASSPDATTNHTATVIAVGDERTTVTTTDGATLVIPWGSVTLQGDWLSESDPPHPAALTNALGTIDDHLNDIDREHTELARRIGVRFVGDHTHALACVEIGASAIPDEVELTRIAAEEIFRIVATEPSADRAHNPGLAFAHVATIVATCCIVLAVMRRYDLDHVTLASHHTETS